MWLHLLGVEARDEAEVLESDGEIDDRIARWVEAADNHGPVTIGKAAKAAVKSAAMCEEVARAVHIARGRAVR